MIRRLLAVARMTLLEAVRSRLLLAIGLVHGAGTAYAVLIGALSLGHESRVIADVSLASFSLVSLTLVVVHAATSVELDVSRKAVLTILTRALHRSEWICGKYLGIIAALLLFAGSGTALSLAIASGVEGTSSRPLLALAIALPMVLALAMSRIKLLASYTYIWPLVSLAAVLLINRDPSAIIFLRGATLALLEAALVAAVALFFATFAGPVPTALFTLGIVLVGRSADMLAKLPKRSFPESVVTAGRYLSHAVPNLHAYVPPHAVLTGLDPNVDPGWLILHGAAHAAAWSVLLLAGAALVTDRRELG